MRRERRQSIPNPLGGKRVPAGRDAARAARGLPPAHGCPALGRPTPFPPLLSAARYAEVVRRCGLTARQAEVLTALTRGLSDAAVAEELGVSLETARKHRQAVLHMCGCASRLQLVLWLVHRFLRNAAGATTDGTGETDGPTP